MTGEDTDLARGVRMLGLGLSVEALERLGAYTAEIETWNPRLGLVGATGRELVVRHLLDSLAGVPFFSTLPSAAKVLDVGTGGGFPGIPLAVALPGLEYVLLDRSERRVTFLEHCVGKLGLANVRIHLGEAVTFRERVDAVTLRAVAPLDTRFVRRSGIAERSDLLVAYKGREENAWAEARAVAGLYPVARVLRLMVPFLEAERHLLVLRRRSGDDERGFGRAPEDPPCRADR